MKIKYSIILCLFLFIQSFTIVMANEIKQKEINISCKDGKYVINDTCVDCGACAGVCPVEAINA